MNYQERLGALHPGAVDAFPIHQLDRLGVPVWTTTLWTDHAVHGCGYGTTDAEALRGALGELVEGAGLAEALPRLPRVTGSYAEIVREHAALDPVSACLEAGTRAPHERELVWVPAERVRTGETVLVPIELVASCFADLDGIAPPREGWLTTPITNGLGAGDTPERALSHGILELLQRDGNSVAYRALDRGVLVEPDRVTDPELAGLLAHIEAAGIELQIKLAATDFGMANVYVVGIERGEPAHPLMVTACGEAVHPDRERAVRKAVLEYCSSRARKAFCQSALDALEDVAPARYRERVRSDDPWVEERRSLDAMLGWLRRTPAELQELMAPRFHAVRSRVALSELPHDPSLSDPVDLLPALLERLEDFDVLRVALDLPDGTPVAKAIVPGLEVETATYHRIGARNVARLLERDDLPALVGATGEEILGTPHRLDTRRLDALVGELYPLYREPDRHVAGRMLQPS